MEANNTAKLRAALVTIDIRCAASRDFDPVAELDTIKAISEHALEEPLRNCDMGTAEEQIKRFETFCQEHQEHWKPSKSPTAIIKCNCPCRKGNGCNYFIWAQMPYEEGVAK